MRIVSIVISNYRQYRSLKLDFGKPSKGGYDLNVLVGKNGFGKTNLANALCWCLWQKEPDLALKEKNSGKPIYNLAAMEELVREGEKKSLEVTVCVKIDIEDRQGQSLLVRRTCRCSTRGLVDEPTLTVVTAQKAGAGFPHDGEEAQYEIERYYPSDLSDYLVFDGERLTTYFQRGQAAKIEQSVRNLSGVQRLDEAIHHHQSVLQDLDGQIRDKSSELREADENKNRTAGEYLQNCEAISRYDQEVQDAELRIQQLREAIGGHRNVPELLSQKDRYEATLRNLAQKMESVQSQKSELIRKYYPVFVVMKQAHVLRAYIKRKQERQEYPPSIKREVFEEILRAGKCVVCGEKLSEKARGYILKQIEKYNKKIVSTETYQAINNLIEPRIVAFIEQLKVYLERRDRILQDEATVARQQEDVEERLQDVRDKLAQVNNAQNYKSMIGELSEREQSQRYARDMLGAAREKAARLLAAKQAAESEYERIRLQNDSDEGRRCQRSIIQGSCRVIEIVRKKMMDEIRNAIEVKANEYWQSLMWKPKDEIGTIRFNHNFTVSLSDDDGMQLIGTLSKAELAMLALSITWAIHSQSGINFPFFIDTPVANMSSDSRRDFANTLKEIAKTKQVVLLFTDTEYVDEIPTVFDQDLNMHKTLNYSRGETQIA